MYGRPGDMLSSVCSGAQHLIIAAPYIKADALTKILADVSPAASLICMRNQMRPARWPRPIISEELRLAGIWKLSRTGSHSSCQNY